MHRRPRPPQIRRNHNDDFRGFIKNCLIAIVIGATVGAGGRLIVDLILAAYSHC